MTRIAGAFFLVLAFAAPTARADEAKPRTLSWWVEGRPWTCSDPVAPVARQVELACDAAGARCRVAGDRAGADRVAAVTCGAKDEPWRLDAEDTGGHVLWSVGLTGDEESRARKAALWIARADGEGPPATPPPVPAPPPKTTESADPPPPTVTVLRAGPPRDKDDDDDGHDDHKSVVAASFTSTLRQEFGAGPMMGGRFSSAGRLGGPLFLGGAIDGVTTPAQNHADFFGHLGVVLAMGAPYTHGTLGIATEGGVSAKGSPSYGDSVAFHAYIKGTAVVQVAVGSDVRPFFALSYLRTSDEMDQMVLADFGLAWGAW